MVKLIFGLGNPDKQYQSTRHNCGKIAITALAKELHCLPFHLTKKLASNIASTTFQQEKIVLAYSTTYMNESGLAVQKLLHYYQLSPSDLWLIYDDIDLPLGKIRIRLGGSAGGHKGVNSVIQAINNDQFIRFRIGIKPKHLVSNVSSFVLKRFTLPEKIILKKTIKQTAGALQMALAQGIEQTMNQFN
ncbi:MAG: aminoacyl-tRNA hydrolase [Candidatus Aenigmarchaeota archaeon]|nr:aminoacyl-tRNA hydrolase [Candidatus Aenigmarchaeota archaeon]